MRIAYIGTGGRPGGTRSLHGGTCRGFRAGHHGDRSPPPARRARGDHMRNPRDYWALETAPSMRPTAWRSYPPPPFRGTCCWPTRLKPVEQADSRARRLARCARPAVPGTPGSRSNPGSGITRWRRRHSMGRRGTGAEKLRPPSSVGDFRQEQAAGRSFPRTTACARSHDETVFARGGGGAQ